MAALTTDPYRTDFRSTDHAPFQKECHSPGGTCDARTELEDDSHCTDHGEHLNEVDVEVKFNFF